MALPRATHLPASRRTPKVRQACDGCRTRKVRCDGCQPCANCVETCFECTFLAVPKQTGPKGKRKARSPIGVADGKPSPFSTAAPSTVRASTGIPLASRVGAQIGASSRNGSQDSSCDDMSRVRETPGVNGFKPSPHFTQGVAKSYLDAFFTYKYPITPIVDRRQVENALPNLKQFPEMYGMMAACSAVMALSPDIVATDDDTPTLPSTLPSSSSQGPAPNTGEAVSYSGNLTADFFISEAIRARNYCSYVERPTLATIQTSFFPFTAFFCLGKDTSAWHYIREAITTLQSLRLHEEATYDDMTDPTMALYARRMFWVLFITERAYALQRHRPLTLQDAIRLPVSEDSSEDEASSILPGFLDLISLFRNFDTEFIAMWNASNSAQFSQSQHYVVKLQQVLDLSLPRVAERTANQQADLLLSREWLKLVVWQLSVSKMLLCSSGPDESMSLQFPVTLAQNVISTTYQLTETALEANGVGILEKIFNVGCSLADVLALKPRGLPLQSLLVGPADYLREIVRIVGTSFGGSPRHLRVLAAKADESLRSATLYVTADSQPQGVFGFQHQSNSRVIEDE